MISLSCGAGTRDCRRSQSVASHLSNEGTSGSHGSAKLIEQTRQLMERTIEFVADPDFECAGAVKRIQALRPASLDTPPERTPSEPGRAFVSGLVQAPLLTPEEERYLFHWMNFLKARAERNRRRLDLGRPVRSLVDRIAADLDEANRVRNQIIEGNLRLIVAIARKLTDSVEQMSELISEGMMPLMRSVELFDIRLGNRFSTYATWAVRNQMLRHLKRARLHPTLSLYAGRFPEEDAPSLENLPDKRPPTERDEVDSRRHQTIVWRLLSSLSERERLVVTARFGLEGQPHGQSLAMIAGQMNLSKERVRQIVLDSLSKLRAGMTPDELDPIS